VILFPLAIKQQKSSAEMVRLQPKLTALQKKHAKDKQKLQEEQMKLYQEEGYNPFGGCLPLLIQMPILFGLYNVIYRPYTYMLHLSSSTITNLVKAFINPIISAGGSAFTSLSKLTDPAAQAAGIIKNSRYEIYLAHALKGHEDIFASITHSTLHVDFNFLGLDLTQTPNWTSVYILIPIVCYITSLISSWMSMKMTQVSTAPGAPNAAGMSKSMILIMPFVSAFFSLSVPAGVGFYWICTNLFMILQVLILNKFYNPKRLAELSEIASEKRKAQKRANSPVAYIEPETEEQSGEQTNLPEKAQQPKRVQSYNSSGKKSKKQLMEENRRRLSAAREQERKRQNH
jgi:YidC/Oxa1 family membrane protein insertase